MERQHDDKPARKYLTAVQLRERYGGVSHMWLIRRLRDDPEFPRPVKIGSSMLRLFALDQVEQYERKCTLRPSRGEREAIKRRGGDHARR